MARLEQGRPTDSLYSVVTRAGEKIDNPPFWRMSELAVSAITDSPRTNEMRGNQIIADNATEIGEDVIWATSLLMARGSTDKSTGMFQGVQVTFKGDKNDLHAYSQNRISITHKETGTIVLRASDLTAVIKNMTWNNYGADELLKRLVFQYSHEVLSESPDDLIRRKVKELQEVNSQLVNPSDNQLQAISKKLGHDLLKYWADVKKRKLELEDTKITATGIQSKSKPREPYVNLKIESEDMNTVVRINLLPGNINGLRLQIKGASGKLDEVRTIT